jgi:multidrug efflux pump subunit AcrB
MPFDIFDAIGAGFEATGIALDAKPKNKVMKILYWLALIAITIVFFVFINTITHIDIIYFIPVLFVCFILALITFGILWAMIFFSLCIGCVCFWILKKLFKLMAKIISLFI